MKIKTIKTINAECLSFFKLERKDLDFVYTYSITGECGDYNGSFVETNDLISQLEQQPKKIQNKFKEFVNFLKQKKINIINL